MLDKIFSSMAKSEGFFLPVLLVIIYYHALQHWIFIKKKDKKAYIYIYIYDVFDCLIILKS